MAVTTTFTALQTEFFARGYDYLNDGGGGVVRAKAWINQAYQELCEEDLWPFLLATAAGAPPLACPDLRTIYSVLDTSTNRSLLPMPEDELTDNFALASDNSPAGPPMFYYVVGDATGSIGVYTYPLGGTLRVRFYQVRPDLSSGSDVVAIPDRFCNLIVDGAVRRAANDVENFATAQAVEQERQAGIERMRMSLMFRDGTRHYQRQTFGALDS